MYPGVIHGGSLAMGLRPLAYAAQRLIEALEGVNAELGSPYPAGSGEDRGRLEALAKELRRQAGAVEYR